MKLMVVAARLLFLLALLALAACGGDEREAGQRSASEEKKAAPGYAASPRKALESWVAAVQAGDVDMMCRLLYPEGACPASVDKKALLAQVREEMSGLTADLRYGAVKIADGGHALIGVVSGESPTAYAVPLARGTTQWRVGNERTDDGKSSKRISLNRPDPALPLESGRNEISFTAWAGYGSGFPLTSLWIDGRPVERTGWKIDVAQSQGVLTPARWTGAAELRRGRHVIVAVVRGGRTTARAWVLTVR